jgi:cardiolipin synthase A/B
MHNLSNFTYANRVKLVRGGRDFFDLLKSLIDEAKETIYFQFYIFDNDSTGREIAEALKAAARRKVRVYMLLDGYASLNLSSDFVDELRDAGIHFRWFRMFFRNKRFFVGRRLHHKVVVVDSEKSIVCGLNVSDRYNDTDEAIAWLDWAVYSEGMISVKLEQTCKRRIKDYSFKRTSEPEFKFYEKCAVRVCVNDWVSRKTEISQCYLKLLKEAKSNVILMTPYFMPGYSFRKALKAAAKRGVKVQVILTGASDILVAKYSERYLYNWLLSSNIEIYEYQRSVLHGKVIVADGECVSVGSYNVNNLSAYASIELNLEIRNVKFAKEAECRLTEIIEHDCVQITSKNSKSNWIEKGLQITAYNFLRLMLFLFAFKQRE